MKFSERVALNTFLSDYPGENKTYDEIIEMMESKDRTVVVWLPFEYYNIDEVIEYIENLKRDIDIAVKHGDKDELS